MRSKAGTGLPVYRETQVRISPSFPRGEATLFHNPASLTTEYRTISPHAAPPTKSSQIRSKARTSFSVYQETRFRISPIFPRGEAILFHSPTHLIMDYRMT